ncbi:Protein grpE [Gossypium australe]|uniref:Protein grpE n=1 Tax=Gossypium australe TaxID=47621 RepID=A0A5B6WXT6_9ROSI|nr:Protein grpE [Gossypium australe]
MLLPEVGAAVSVLLGVAPTVKLSASGSSKLNEVLIPNPFDRPRAVFMFEVGGIDDPLVVEPKNALFSKALKNSVDLGSSKADILFPGVSPFCICSLAFHYIDFLADEEELSMISLDHPLGDYCEEEINEFASWLGGSYATDVTKPLDGVLTIPLANGDNMNLHMSKVYELFLTDTVIPLLVVFCLEFLFTSLKALGFDCLQKVHREFASKLFALYRNIRKAMERHEDLSQTLRRPAELIMGSFDGIKHDTDGFDKQGMRLLLATLNRIFDSLQTTYEGHIVGVILFNGVPQPESKTLMNMMYTSRPSARWLEETKSSLNTTLAAQMLVRRTLAWITGVVLLIATLLGVYFLLNMPLTRDTLLYSNVKLD